MYNVKGMGRDVQGKEEREAGEELKEALPASLGASHPCSSAALVASVPALLFWCVLCSMWDFVDAITKKKQ